MLRAFVWLGFRNVLYASKREMSEDRYIWVDLEMTGLEVEKDKILEVACIITTPDLKPVHNGINIVVHENDETLNSMNDWCQINHSKSGLIEASRNSNINIKEAETQLVTYVKQFTKINGVNYLAGNSVYMDRLFIAKYMPSFDSLLHYRILDVSSFKILFSHIYPEFVFSKNLSHRSLDDIKESIEELKAYKKYLMK